MTHDPLDNPLAPPLFILCYVVFNECRSIRINCVMLFPKKLDFDGNLKTLWRTDVQLLRPMH